jgi:pseudouridine-5'-phosphate glycosidase
LAQPVAEDVALGAEEVERAVAKAEAEAEAGRVSGGAVTPFLLKQLGELTGGRSLRANQALIVANARLAAEVAKEL